MKSFLTLPPHERYLYFQEAATRTGRFSALIFEKDFWVCWTLQKLFNLPNIGQHLTFKGGTSLSKIYKVIQRFSEDIDVSIHRSFFGFDGELDPENSPSNAERERRLLALSETSTKFINSDLVPALDSEFRAQIGEGWRLVVDQKDPQTILFFYPTVAPPDTQQYIAPAVKIEFGSRSDNWPQSAGEITPYITEVYPEVLRDIGTLKVQTLSLSRTFWEKATILHAEYHRPPTKMLPTRHSRHFYDIYCISKEANAGTILRDHALLDRVVQHKKSFFRSGWANYDSATAGSLRLYPKSSQLENLAADYRSMQSMFYDTSPKFDEILDGIKKIEAAINE